MFIQTEIRGWIWTPLSELYLVVLSNFRTDENKISLFFAGDDVFVLPVRLQYIAADAQRHD